MSRGEASGPAHGQQQQPGQGGQQNGGRRSLPQQPNGARRSQSHHGPNGYTGPGLQRCGSGQFGFQPSQGGAQAPGGQPFFPASLHHNGGFGASPLLPDGSPYSVDPTAASSTLPMSPEAMIVDVWAEDLEAAFVEIRQIVVQYPYIAMDTEFPGVVARPVGNFRSNTEFYYQTLRCNVNLLKIIQIGITFANEQGQHPPGHCTWQFNFKFNLTDDIYAQDSIDLLTTSGIDFDRFAQQGIEVGDFAELLITSGLVLGGDPPVRWLSFHSGYDFGYLLKILTDTELPADEDEFFDMMETYFPGVFDVKYLLKQPVLQQAGLSDMSGLNKLGEDLHVERIGPAHQAGSDSLLTCHCFFKLAHEYFSESSKDQSIFPHAGVLFGLGQDSAGDGIGNGRDYLREERQGAGGGSPSLGPTWGVNSDTPPASRTPNGTPNCGVAAPPFPTSPVAEHAPAGNPAEPGVTARYIQHVVLRGCPAPIPGNVRNMVQHAPQFPAPHQHQVTTR